MIASFARHWLWRGVLSVTGGLRVGGRLPGRPSVLVANHASHADTVALLAALPARRQPVVAAAADYWFGRPARTVTCRTLVGAFPVRRTGGGSADLAKASELLARGHDVIVYPEGSRSRDGELGAFHSGAARLAEAAGAPLVPIGIHGTRGLLPAHGRLRPTRISVQIGHPVGTMAEAREQVQTLSRPVPAPDSRLRQRVAAFAASGLGIAAMALWAFGEALILPLLPEFLLVILVLAAPRQAPRLALVAAIASLAGGAAMYGLGAHGVHVPAPWTTARMHATVTAELAESGPDAVHGQPLSGIPYKVYGQAAGRAHTGVGSFVAASVPARGLRILLIGGLAGLVGAVLARWRRWYPVFMVAFVTVFGAGLATVIWSWR